MLTRRMSQSLTCGVCARRFSRAFSRKRHEQKKHSEAPQPQVKCLECDRSFSRPENLKRHQDSHHGAGKAPCAFCKRRFRKDYLVHHQYACRPNLNHLLSKADPDPKRALEVQDLHWQKVQVPSVAGPQSLSGEGGLPAVSKPVRKSLAFVHEAGFRPLTEADLYKARRAIKDGDLTELKDILQGQGGPWASIATFDKAYTDARGETMLTTAVRFRHIDVVGYVLASGLALHEQRCNFLKCPLSVAIENGDTEIVEILIAGGAPVDGRHKCCPKPLTEAVRGRQVEVVEQLLEHGVSVAPSPQTMHPLLLAIQIFTERVIGVLLRKIGDPNRLYYNEISPATRVTALYQAALYDRITVARDLIDNWGADVNLGDSPPLEAALQYGSAAMVELLLNARANLALVTDTTWEDVYNPSFYQYGRLSQGALFGEVDKKKALLHQFFPETVVKMDEFFFADSRFPVTELWLHDGLDFDDADGILDGLLF